MSDDPQADEVDNEDLVDAMHPGAIVCSVAECPECGAAVLTKVDGDGVTSCADHGG
jgi:uncharacterized Zn finger protein (UPF0148 family)